MFRCTKNKSIYQNIVTFIQQTNKFKKLLNIIHSSVAQTTSVFNFLNTLQSDSLCEVLT